MHKDGSWRWLHSTISNLTIEPSVSAIVFNYRDVTDQKQAEEQIQRQLQRLRALHDIDVAISSSFDMQVSLEVLLRDPRISGGREPGSAAEERVLEHRPAAGVPGCGDRRRAGAGTGPATRSIGRTRSSS